MAANDLDNIERPDLAGLFSRYRRYFPLVVAGAVLGLLLAGLASVIQSKQYTAVASLIFAPQASTLIQGGTGPLTDQARDAAIDAQVQMLQSLSVASKVVANLHLDRDAKLVEAATRYAGNPQEMRNAMATALLQNVRARRSGQTTIIEITHTDGNPLHAAEVANGFVKAYLDEQVAQKLAQARGDASRVDSRLSALRQQVQNAEVAVARFKVDNGLISTTGSTLAEQEISALNGELASTRAQQVESEARLGAAQRQTRTRSVGQDTGEALASPVVASLRQQRAEAASNAAEMESRYGALNPALITARERVAELDKAIQQEVNRILSNVRTQASVASERTASVTSSLQSAKGRLAANNAASVRLGELQRDADSAKTLYESFLATSKQNNANEALIQPDARLAAPATPPLSPSAPNVPVNLLLGALLGLGLGIGAAFLRDRWVVGLDTIDDIERNLGQTYLNSLPTLTSSIDKPSTKDPMDAVVAHPMSRYAEAFRSLATTMLYSSGTTQKVQVLGITSALPKEGKTTTAVCVARVLAMGGTKVALLDADLRRRSVTEALAPRAENGMIEVLNGKVPLDVALLTDESTGLRFLPLGPGAHLAKSPFGSPEFEEMMKFLRSQYEVIILDTAPILAVVDTRMLLHHIDAMAMLARWRVTPIKAIRAAIHQIESVGGRILGVAMTMVNAKTQAQAGYGDPSYYYTEMKDYYTDAP